MKRLGALALALAAALPACAQRGGGGHAGFASHAAPVGRSAPAFHSSFAPPAPFHYSGTAHAPMIYAPQRSPVAGLRYPGTVPITRPSFYHHGGITITHNFTGYPYTYGYGYYPGGAYYVGGFYDGLYDDWYDNYDIAQQPLEPDNGYGYPPQPDYSYPQSAPDSGYAYPQPMPEPQYGYAYPQPMPAYPVYPQSAPEASYAYPQPAPGYQVYVPAPTAPQMQYVPGSSDLVILIYRDGRPPEQIQNYLATRTTLTILDGGRRRVVPLSELDIPATTRANRQTGVDFRLPTATP
jgi:hypothetical protein